MAMTVPKGKYEQEYLKRYSNDYQAEINRRKSIDPGDPGIFQLNELRNEKKRINGLDNYGNTISTNSLPTPPTPAPTVPTATDYYSKHLAEIQQANDLSRQQAEEANRLRTESAVTANNAYIPQLNQQSDRRLQEAYIGKEQAMVNTPQSLSALGMTGGAAESSLLGLTTNYQNNRNTIETERGQGLQDIQQNEQNIRATGDAGLADLGREYYNRSMQNMQTAAQQAQDQSNWQQSFDANQQSTAQSDFTNTAGAYYNDYQAQINKVQGDNDPNNDWQIPILQAERVQKQGSEATAQADKEQQAIENYIRTTQLNYNVGKPYYNPNTGSGGRVLTVDKAMTEFTKGNKSEEVLKILRAAGYDV